MVLEQAEVVSVGVQVRSTGESGGAQRPDWKGHP